MKTRLSAACAALLLAGSACSSASEEADGGKPKANPGAVASAQASGASRSTSPTSAAPTPGPSAASSSSAPRKSASPVAPTDWLAEGSQSDGFPTDAGHAFPSSSRVGSHPGYERVVVQYTGGAADLTWKTTWTSDPIDEKGERINVKGDVFLQIDVAGVREPSDVATLPPTLHPGSLAGLSTVKGVSVQYPFEGQHMVLIGLSAKGSYRIQVLKDPSRLVIDVKKG